MRLALTEVIHRPGASISFSECVDLSDLQYGNTNPVTEPVKAEGTVRKTADVLMMKGKITTCLHGVCDRCAGEFTRDVEIDLDVVLVEQMYILNTDYMMLKRVRFPDILMVRLLLTII